MSAPVPLVADTSVLTAALFESGSKRLLEAWRKGRVILCHSGPVMREYRRVLPKIPPIREKAAGLLDEIERSPHTRRAVRPAPLRFEIGDEDDRKFVECAVATGADYIVSLDHHLLDLFEYEDVSILRPGAFLEYHPEVR